MAIETEWRDYDVIVVGSGGAGSHAADAAQTSGARVLVVSKDPIGCSDTKISEGIAAVRESGASDDSEDTLSENLRMAGADLPLQSITDAFAKDSQQAYDTYRRHGLRPSIDTRRNTPQALPIPMGGHNKRRSVGHENSGVAFGHATWDAVISGAGIDYLEDAWFLDLITQPGTTQADHQRNSQRVAGGLIYDAARGKLIAVRAPSVVIAAGGLSTLYFPKTDTMRGNTGDSYAIAARAGADMVDMEQVQFLPFCLTSPPSYEGLLCGEPATASFLGVLRDRDGKVILDSVYLRTRAECSAAIMRAVEAGRGTSSGGALLDLTANKIPARSGPYFMQYLQSSLPTAYRNARQAMGKKAAQCEEPWEVRPGAHYHMGGIRVDENGRSSGGERDGNASLGIAGLYAAGQAMGGLFGANRLGSTSLTEGAVFGARAGAAAARDALQQTARADKKHFTATIDKSKKRFGQQGPDSAAALKLELQKASWSSIGPARTQDALQQYTVQLEQWRERLEHVSIPEYALWNQAFIEYEELRNMLQTASLVCSAALERDASVGGHVRLDRGNVPTFATPYSTLVRHRPDGTSITQRLARQRTPLARMISVKCTDQWRRFKARLLRMAPATLQDKILEQRYRTIMGNSGNAPEMMPGGNEAAVGEA